MNHERLMHGLSIQSLRFTVRALDTIIFNDQAGSALRGALYQVLADNFCSEAGLIVTPDHQERCPVCWLLAAEDNQAARGRNISRPLTIEPPIGATTFPAGSSFTFGYSLIGRAQDLLPYVARAVQKMGRIGIGRGRKRFKLITISEHNAILDVDRELIDGNIVKKPTLQITPSRISELASQLPQDRLTFEFLTPVRLTTHHALAGRLEPMPFVQRLIERCQNLAEHYAETDAPPTQADWYQAYQTLTTQARDIRIAYDNTTWVEARSGSRRTQTYTPISGFIGTVCWEGALAPLLPWLIWGTSLHVGKNAVKGNGWYRLKP